MIVVLSIVLGSFVVSCVVLGVMSRVVVWSPVAFVSSLIRLGLHALAPEENSYACSQGRQDEYLSFFSHEVIV